MDRTRREFLADVGRGMLVASVGAATAAELDLVPAAFADDKKRPPLFRQPGTSGWADAGHAG